MYFTQTAYYREIENIMRQIPNFRPRGHGSMILKNEMKICMEEQSPPDSYVELMTRTMSAIHYKPFIGRLNNYMQKGEMSKLIYRNETHKSVFETAIAKLDKRNFALLSAVYLLSADFRLWQIMKPQVKHNTIDFMSTKLNNIHENGYTLYCAAKDLYLGTRHLSVSDLADTGLIPPKIFSLICNAMAIRRFGIQAIQLAKESDKL